MNTLNIYSQKYDLDENIINGGLSGKVFLDKTNEQGISFDCIDNALDYISINNIPIHMIEFNYVDNNKIQMFKKFEIVSQ